MSHPRQQCTIAQPQTITGFGYWTGRDTRVELRAAPANSGITFVRCDCDPVVRIPATAAARLDTPLRTILQAHGERVEMVEHVLAAFAGLGIDNCEVWCNAPEMPGMDGSAQAFVEALDRAGRLDQAAHVETISISTTIRIGDQHAWIQLEPSQEDGLTIDYELDYGAATSIGKQRYAVAITPDAFRRELARCRTFILQEQAQALISKGLGARVTPHDLLIFGEDGPVENELRFQDECVRHKILDVVGDLALLGGELQGRLTAFRSGHRLNGRLVEAVLEQTNSQQALHVA